MTPFERARRGVVNGALLGAVLCVIPTLVVGLPAAASDAVQVPVAPTAQNRRADVVVFEPRAANLDPAVVAALGSAIEDALRAALPEATVVGPAPAAERLSTTGTPAAAAAALGAEQWITVRAIELDGITEVALTRHRPGFRPVAVRSALPAVDDLPLAARAWIAQLLAAPDPAPPPPAPADAQQNDRLTMGLVVGGVWAVAETSLPLVHLAAELHDRSGRWFIAGSLGARLPATGDADGRYGVAFARLRSGIYGGSGPAWPALWLGIEPRLISGSGGEQFGLMPAMGVGLDLTALGATRLSVEAEAGYNLIGFDTALPAPAAEDEADGAPPADPIQPVEIGLSLGIAW